MTREIDVAIVGAGPAGLYAAYCAGFRGLSVVVVDALSEPGGQVVTLYPEKIIYDVAGFPAIRGRELVSNLLTQAARHKPEYHLGIRAERLSYAGGKPVLTLADGETFHCGAVVVTGGMGNFTARPLPAAAGFAGRGLVYFVPRLEEHAGQDVVIVGGGDSAFDWAVSLRPLARSVTLIHRRDTFRAHASTVARARALDVPILVNAEVTGVYGDGRVSGVQVTVKGQPPRDLPADAIVAALGFTADLGPLTDWGLKIDRCRIVVDTAMATNLPRVFAAGDICDYPGKVRLISVGFGEAATAVNNAAVAIDPSAHLFPGHSSGAA